jgi:hypothetical protein
MANRRIKSDVVQHLALDRNKRLPIGYLALDILPRALLPFSHFKQTRTMRQTIRLRARDYRYVGGGDREMRSWEGRETRIRLKAVATVDNPTKPTKVIVHVVDHHAERSSDYTAFVSNGEFEFPIELAANEYFKEFVEHSGRVSSDIEGRHHGWVQCGPNGIIAKCKVKFDGPTGDDGNAQAAQLSLAISYIVIVNIP